MLLTLNGSQTDALQPSERSEGLGGTGTADSATLTKEIVKSVKKGVDSVICMHGTVLASDNQVELVKLARGIERNFTEAANMIDGTEVAKGLFAIQEKLRNLVTGGKVLQLTYTPIKKPSDAKEASDEL